MLATRGESPPDPLGKHRRRFYIWPMRRSLLILAGVLAVANTSAEMLGARPVVYVLKPLATLALVALVLRARNTTPYRTWITAGLTASLAGDILLMLPHGLFVPGLVAFLIGHCGFIAAFASDGAGVRAPKLPALPVYAAALAVLVFLWPSLGAMRVPVVCYVAVISTMAWQAVARWTVLRTAGAAYAAVGSVFFLVSDSALAIRKFVVAFPAATFVVMATYYVAQFGLALSVPDADSDPA